MFYIPSGEIFPSEIDSYLPKVEKIVLDFSSEGGNDINVPASRDSSTRTEVLFPPGVAFDGSEVESGDLKSEIPLGFAPRVIVKEATDRSGIKSPSSQEGLDTVYLDGSSSPSSFISDFNIDKYDYREVVIDANGRPRQAGSDSMPEARFIQEFRKIAERELFVFLKGVLGRLFLTDHFHRKICEFIQQVPPFRKLILMPREHAKTAIVSGGLPLHILIQEAEDNIYFPGLDGSDCRILLAGETERMAKKNLRVVKSVLEENKLFRALWPNRCWEVGSKGAKEWSSESIIIPRTNEWPDPTIKAVGVGGAITGARPNVMIKDDLVSFKAMNSEVVMQEAIDWHVASRALLDTYETESGLSSLEFIIGTRWAVFDLYSYIIDNDPSVEVNDEEFHRIIRDGKILWPEKHTEEDIKQLQLEHGKNFFLLYLNSAADPSLTDFDVSEVRKFIIAGNMIKFKSSEKDIYLERRMNQLGGKSKEIIAEERKFVRGERLALDRLSELLKGGVGCRIRA